MEIHGMRGAFVYAHDERSLTVNLFIASEVSWRKCGVLLRQETRFPDVESTQLSLQLRKPRRCALKLRHPAWLDGPMRVRLNGREWPLQSKPSSYISIDR